MHVFVRTDVAGYVGDLFRSVVRRPHERRCKGPSQLFRSYYRSRPRGLSLATRQRHREAMRRTNITFPATSEAIRAKHHQDRIVSSRRRNRRHHSPPRLRMMRKSRDDRRWGIPSHLCPAFHATVSAIDSVEQCPASEAMTVNSVNQPPHALLHEVLRPRRCATVPSR